MHQSCWCKHIKSLKRIITARRSPWAACPWACIWWPAWSRPSRRRWSPPCSPCRGGLSASRWWTPCRPSTAGSRRPPAETGAPSSAWPWRRSPPRCRPCWDLRKEKKSPESEFGFTWPLASTQVLIEIQFLNYTYIYTLLSFSQMCGPWWPGLKSQIPPSWRIFTAKFRPSQKWQIFYLLYKYLFI